MLDLGFLLHTVLPIAAFATSIASAASHWWMAFKKKQDHQTLVDQVAAALGQANAKANPSAPDNSQPGGGA